jgi:hypothetical protein
VSKKTAFKKYHQKQGTDKQTNRERERKPKKGIFEENI